MRKYIINLVSNLDVIFKLRKNILNTTVNIYKILANRKRIPNGRSPTTTIIN